MSKWSDLLLKDLLVLTKDGEWGKGEPADGLSAMTVIRGTDFSDVRLGRLNEAPTRYIPIHIAERKKLQPTDILIETAGGTRDQPTGRTVFLKPRLFEMHFRPITCASFSRFLRVNPDLAHPEFVYWYLQSLYAAGEMEQHQIQHTGVARFQYTKFAETTRIPIPPLFEQRAIASVLGSLDDKIELNRRMNETLEALAQSLFKSWFVDATQSALPKGWREGKVSDLATLSRDGLNPGEFPDETFDHYSLPAFDEGRTPKPERGDTIMSNKFIVQPNCVMVSKLNPRIPRIWLPDMRGQNRAVCSTEFLVATPKPGVSREYLYCLFINESFVSVFTTMVTGTSGSHQRVRPESLLSMDTPLPPAPLIQKFTDTVAPMLKRISQNIHESRTLAALRDALLPKLLSGELRVPAAKLKEDYVGC